MKKFVFLAGLPRTGSTVLGTLLSQHPDLKTTATSVVKQTMEYVLNLNLGQSLYYDRYEDESQLWGILRGILNGAYENCSESVVIEKGRDWAKNINITERVIGEVPKIIAPVRSIPDILSSFILVAKKIGPTAKIYDEVTQTGREINEWSLTRVIWEKYVYGSWRVFKTGYETRPECFHLVEYDNLVKHPEDTFAQLCDFVDLPTPELNTQGLCNPHPENDAVYGLPGLHFVRPELKRTSPPALQVLGEECYLFWKNEGLEFWRG